MPGREPLALVDHTPPHEIDLTQLREGSLDRHRPSTGLLSKAPLPPPEHRLGRPAALALPGSASPPEQHGEHVAIGARQLLQHARIGQLGEPPEVRREPPHADTASGRGGR